MLRQFSNLELEPSYLGKEECSLNMGKRFSSAQPISINNSFRLIF